MVEIANPIYDVVFKYLMKDEKIARLLLSGIIGREVVELEFRPTEHHFPVGEMLMVMRMDFSARILDEQGNQELVIIELQKAKFATDILRFRRYLGEQYANKENIVRDPGREEYPYRKALPILSIYFLGHTLERIKAPVVRVNRRYVDAATGQDIQEREEFIESLTHDSIIIQIPYLKGRRRTDLEQLLALFDQTNQTKDRHFLEIDEEELPERYRPLLRRLQTAMADQEVRYTMEAEDEIIEEFKSYQQQISQKEYVLRKIETDLKRVETDLKKTETNLKKTETNLKKTETELRIHKKAIQEKEQTIQEKERIIREKEQALQQAVRELFRSGMDKARIASILQLDAQAVEAFLIDNDK